MSSKENLTLTLAKNATNISKNANKTRDKIDYKYSIRPCDKFCEKYFNCSNFMINI